MRKMGWLLAVLCASLTVTGCPTPTTPPTRPATAEGAILAFDALYPGFKATSAESSAGVWIITGEYIPTGGTDTYVPVRVPISVGGSGVASATVAGVAWTGSVDLSALTEVRQPEDGDFAETVASELGPYGYAPGFVVTDVRRESTDVVVVTAETTDEARPPLRFVWSEGSWSADLGEGEYEWLQTVGGVKVGRDEDVTKALGPGLFTDREGHAGGRYYTNARRTVTLHIEIGVDGMIEVVELTDGIALPSGLRASDDPAFVSPGLPVDPSLDGGVRLGASVEAVVRQFGKPDEDLRTGVQRILIYDLDTGDGWTQPYGWAQFTFVQGELRSVSYEGIE